LRRGQVKLSYYLSVDDSYYTNKVWYK
jgi:hypothetical protein